MKIINPATEEVIKDVEPTPTEKMAQYHGHALQAQKQWAQVSINDRLKVLDSYEKRVKDQRDELARLLTLETGKPISQARNEVTGSLDRVRHLKRYAHKWLESEVLSTGDVLEFVCYEPLGVIANISAWNYPYNVGYNVFLYALTAGNAVLYKPSEYATLTGLKIAELLEESGLPGHLFNVIVGDGSAGQQLLELPLDAYFFTGSHRTGLEIAKSVAPKLVPLQLELGGKDPLYVMEDVADVKQAAINAAEGAFYNNGQSCCAIERIYVHEAIYQDFVSHFVSAVKGYQIGDPMSEQTFIGPLTRSEQLGVFEKQCADALAKGAKLLLGGKRIQGKGFYFEPTIFVDVNHDMDLMKSESFGPIIGIQKVTDDSEALGLMDDTEYGLTASVFSADESRARTLLDQLDVGTAYWNCCDRVSPNVPWSGRRHSGLGSTLGASGIRTFTKPKAYHWKN
ncbi:aldehyde dehydrogenase family protein [Marinoscillum furvescens]|uniref:Acyl-CoA reductase-like NAD-dependent aldehyde dehydrogenase n=1 Tax=Marinoscillum furvescens DSM 4134 TaxID=1122208 RepID=A0A3D9L6N7_MARFU|nr:aldehyde dehydrogenase family protein [Marinoscillum furvescens]REE00570.1 acyl-CoA reductase-like NAD-dependent aldehyde dehydrogenase [Marinoscillum furvescens DSM 4134]